MSSLEPSYLISQLPSSTSGVENPSFKDQYWMYSTFTLLALMTAVLVYGKLKLTQAKKNLQFEQFKSQDLKKKLKLAFHTIKKMETNPDLVHSRSFNLDYLRMRMDEEVFHYVIVNQIKMKIIQLIGEEIGRAHV